MKNRTNIGPDDFLAAFRIAVDARAEDLQSQYSNSRDFTDRMLGCHGRDGVLRDVATRLRTKNPDLEYKQEYYTIDALMVSGHETIYTTSQPAADGTKLWYPSRLDVLVEHENGEKLEEEMWKLLFWHAGLKVIIGYDWCERDKGRTTKREWAEKKIAKLRKMHDEADTFTRDRPPFLLILGNRDNHGKGPIRWRWCRLDVGGDPQDLHQ